MIKTGPSAIAKMRSTLGEVVIEGVQTNLDFQYDILNQKELHRGKRYYQFHTRALRNRVNLR